MITLSRPSAESRIRGSSISNNLGLFGSEFALQSCRQFLMRLTILNASPHDQQILNNNRLFAQFVITIANQ